ncbi:MAG: Gfo/Idh/MocA family oxidoreductase, partial [Jatrophihabitantaceae bacterium]
MTAPIRLAIVGSGWRGQFFARLAAKLPAEVELVGGCVRRTELVTPTAASWQVPVHTSVTELVQRERPQLVVVCVGWQASPAVISELVGAGVRVLAETPPAPDTDGLRGLWQQVGGTDSVQVAEQYLLMPAHAARLELVRGGVIGRASSVQVSSTHTYHAVSLIRGLLDAGYGPVRISAQQQSAPLVDPLTRDAWTDDDEAKPAVTTLATIDFRDGKSGLYDFTDTQWHNQLRMRRIVVRGSHGEIVGDDVVRLAGPRLILRSALHRSQLGYDLNLDGYDTEHIS